MKTETQIREVLEHLTQTQREMFPTRKPAVDAAIDTLHCVLGLGSTLDREIDWAKANRLEMAQAMAKKGQDEAQLRAAMGAGAGG